MEVITIPFHNSTSGNSLSGFGNTFFSTIRRITTDSVEIIEKAVEDIEKNIIDPIEQRATGKTKLPIANTIFMVLVTVGGLLVLAQLIKKLV